MGRGAAAIDLGRAERAPAPMFRRTSGCVQLAHWASRRCYRAVEAEAGEVNELQLQVGERVDLQSLSAAVIPPHLMLLPFVEVPETIEVEGQDGLDEDGDTGRSSTCGLTRPANASSWGVP
jgi:hypothetical protein